MQTTKRVKNPRKQRKMLYNAPAHIRHKHMAAPLSKELAQSKGAKTLPVRKGDTVHIQRGDNKGFEGKVSRVDLKSYRIYIEGLTREKVDGTNIFIGVHPSKVMIKNLSLDDNRRKAVLERKEAPGKPKGAKKAALKAKAEVVKTPEQEETAEQVSLETESEQPVKKEESTKKKSAKKVKPTSAKTKKSATAKKALRNGASKSGAKRKTAEKTEGER